MNATHEVLATVLMKIRDIWNMTPCRLVYMPVTDSRRDMLQPSSEQCKPVTPDDWSHNEWSFVGKENLKYTLVQALRHCKGRTAHWGSRGIALPFLAHGTRRGWGVSVTSQPLFTPGREPVSIVQEAGWVRGPVWTGAENLAPTGIRSSDRPARSHSLYRLHYPAHSFVGTAG